MEKILIVSLFTLLSLLPVQAQKRVGDFIESTSYNEDKRGAVRELQYVPEYAALPLIGWKPVTVLFSPCS